jgi:hypothetical protein
VYTALQTVRVAVAILRGDFGIRDKQEEESASMAAGSLASVALPSGYDVALMPVPAQRVRFGTGLSDIYSDVARYQHHFKDLV